MGSQFCYFMQDTAELNPITIKHQEDDTTVLIKSDQNSEQSQTEPEEQEHASRNGSGLL